MEVKDCNEIKGRLTDVLSETKEIETHYWAIMGLDGLPLYVAEYAINVDEPEKKIWTKNSSLVQALSVIQDGFASKEEAEEAMTTSAAEMLCAQIGERLK